MLGHSPKADGCRNASHPNQDILNTDGSLSKSPEILGDHYKTGGSLYDAIVESARRALWRCQPLKNLPVNKYAVWKVIILTFDADTYMANRGM